MKDYRISVTGHRPKKLDGYNLNTPYYHKLKEALRASILELVEKNAPTAETVYLISGMALGVDTLFAQVALDLHLENPKFKLYAAVPFTGQANKWLKESKDMYRDILSKAYYVNDLYPHNPSQFIDNATAGRLLNECSEYMVDHAHAMIAVWDGTSGGTGNCVAYAESGKSSTLKEVLKLHPALFKS